MLKPSGGENKIGHPTEIALGERFEFGENWSRFLAVLDEARIEEAERSLKRMLGLERLSGKRFLDIGSGSGLFSLAARRMGATVHSFDFDPKSVACTQELKRRYCPQEAAWSIEKGSVLDRDYLQSLGKFDVVYSWGVLHHTGAMWQALENAAALVADGGFLFISIYNDQLYKSVLWRKVKQFYCSGPLGKGLTVGFFIPYFVLRGAIFDLLCLKNPLKRYSNYKKERGMARWTDWFDWLGGYPFEVAKPEEIFNFYHQRGYRLQKLKTCGAGLGCNEFVFTKEE
ncbi:class I SAM-dependent methyltransferase [Candidatus Manganitrophus noduliformans]|uniref:class I SAM-dependent methyltransferase n=1 Tax=Candidatus Manganitrophus noduliformans TaxID=2606439 RepID=UPI0015E38385|nr:class I SAM-dependent methyltransferase [Candidatus Manganitrophus noduliformans]